MGANLTINKPAPHLLHLQTFHPSLLDPYVLPIGSQCFEVFLAWSRLGRNSSLPCGSFVPFFAVAFGDRKATEKENKPEKNIQWNLILAIIFKYKVITKALTLFTQIPRLVFSA